MNEHEHHHHQDHTSMPTGHSGHRTPAAVSSGSAAPPDREADATDVPAAINGRVIYTCPMHPQIRKDGPGICPICGMTLEPVMPTLDTDDNPELEDFRRRFWWTLPLTAVVTLLAMFGHRIAWPGAALQSWIELLFSLPVVLWAGAPFSCAVGSLSSTVVQICGHSSGWVPVQLFV